MRKAQAEEKLSDDESNSWADELSLSESEIAQDDDYYDDYGGEYTEEVAGADTFKEEDES